MNGHLLELRVHGVSNTPPADILGLETEPAGPPADPEPAARPVLVAGDATTGFYRSSSPDPGDPVTVEAYSWGQLTSGGRTAKDVERALWTVLLPFTLANIALHARPDIPADPDRDRWASRSGIAAWLVRLLCLSLTGTLVLAASGVGVDLIGWQCVDPRCLGQLPGPWELLATGWWSAAARPLAVGLLLPLGLVTLVGLLTWRTYQYEADLPTAPAGPDDRQPADNPLQHPTFWCGEGQVRRLAVLHLATGAAVAALVPLGAVLAANPAAGVRAGIGWAAAAALGGTVLLSAAALGHPYATRRGGQTPLGRYAAVLVGLSLAGVLGTMAVLLLPDGSAGAAYGHLRPPIGCATDRTIRGCGEDRSLPGFDQEIAWLASFQVLLLIALGGVSRTGRRALAGPATAAAALVPLAGWTGGWLPGVPAAPGWLPTWVAVGAVFALTAAGTLLLPRRPTARIPDPSWYDRMAWGGCGPAVLAGLGWLLGISYSAGALYWTTDRLNRGGSSAGIAAIVPPVPVMWAGPAFLLALLALLGTAGRVWFEFAASRRHLTAELVASAGPLSAHERRRIRDVAAFQALHQLVGRRALRLIGQLVAVAAGLAGLATAVALAGGRPTPRGPEGWTMLVRAAVDGGALLAGLLPVLIAAVGLLVYRNDTVRRAVGVIWDIGTFWPRAAHPLAPPSYAERAVPQVQTRVTGLMALPEDDPHRMDAVILSGHSQGAVISTAVILQLPSRWRHRVWFFSYGCQLSRLYGRVFPAYFGPDRLPAVTTALTPPAGAVCWTNFWRRTDPLGWSVPAGERDVMVRDPEALHPNGGEVSDPPIRSHGGYPQAPEYRQERVEVAARLTAWSPLPAAQRSPDMDRAGDRVSQPAVEPHPVGGPPPP